MASFKIRKAQTLGALAAEDGSFLTEVFVDSGYLATLLDTADPRFLVLGRTGAGKTAILRQVREKAVVGCIDPEELSMQHLHNSTILPKLVDAGVNLDVFYKYLWRHVCVLELIRIRYDDESDLPGAVSRLFDLSLIINRKKREEVRKQKETREAAITYLDKYGAEYWVKTDTRIKKITEELESKLGTDDRVAAELGVKSSQLAFSTRGRSEERQVCRVEREIAERAQTIVSDFLVSDLSKVVKLLGEHGFSDQQNNHYLVIDDLDKNWMPNSGMYVGLVKALLHTVRELNRQLPAAKIIVALRDNVFKRVFAASSTLEPQREKWLDVQLPIRWEEKELTELVDKRLETVARHNYTKDAPSFADFLPRGRAKKRIDPERYIIERTLMRPRDLLDFLNTCIRITGSLETLTWRIIRLAEQEYSTRRFAALIEEWRGTYDGLAIVVDWVKRFGAVWRQSALTDDMVDAILSSPGAESERWLRSVRDRCLAGRAFDDIRGELVATLLDVGFLVLKGEGTHRAVESSDPMLMGSTAVGSGTLIVHKMFWAALGFSEESVRTGDDGHDDRAG